MLSRPFKRSLQQLHRFFSTMEVKASRETIDEANLKVFSDITAKWWDLKGPMALLHSMNDLRVPFIRNGLINNGQVSPSLSSDPNCLQGIKILDVGCGGGILSMPLARLGGSVIGIDASPELIACAQTYASNRLACDDENERRLDVRFEVCTIEDHAKVHEGQYDAVVASEVVEHVNNQEMFMSSCVAALKPGGSLFVTTFNQTTLSWLSAVVFGEYITRIIPTGTHDWRKFVSATDMKRLLESFGCTTILVNGFTYLPIKGWFWIPTSSTFSYALHAVKDKQE